MKISVVTPLYKSAPYIVELHQRSVAAIRATGAQEYEIIFVNDGSPDESLEIASQLAAEDPCVIVVDLSRNFGQHRAILAGLAQTSGDYIFVMDSDLEEQPEWIALFYEKLRGGAIDVVYGVQKAKKRGIFYRASRQFFIYYSIPFQISASQRTL